MLKNLIKPKKDMIIITVKNIDSNGNRKIYISALKNQISEIINLSDDEMNGVKKVINAINKRSGVDIIRLHL